MAETTDSAFERVAFDLCESLKVELKEKDGKPRIEAVLNLFVACRRAARAGLVDVSAIT